MSASIFHQIEDKTKRPTMKELNRYVVNQYAIYWRDIGFELDLECSKIDNIKANCFECEDRLYEVLKAWLQVKDHATWKTLEVAIINVKRLKSGADPVNSVEGDCNTDELKTEHRAEKLPQVVIELSSDLCSDYKRNRQRLYEEEWPPNQPSSIVNLALIHYKSTRTQQELIEISKRCKEGASHLDKFTSSHSNVTTDIQKIFMLEGDSEPPKRILIEGAPGIGKTILAKEIAYQWANGRLLQEYKLVFLLYLRDPKLHEVKSVNEIFELFTSESSADLKAYVNKSRGENIAFVFDGFDEYPVALQKESFVTNLIKGENDGRMFHNSAVVVTSRPTATLFLHRVVDRRIEILGFPREERAKYISFSLGDSLDKKHKLGTYLKQHPVIDNLCYIPLHLAILMYLFQQDSLPETLTEMNESFIINTIYRYLERHNLTPLGVVKILTDLPSNIVEFVYQLSQLAFEGLCNNQLVYTYEEIKKNCPEVDTVPGAINGFGLLQAVQHYPKRGAGRTTSVNFLHFTMQEYLAALHVSRLPSEEQSSLMKKTFWDGQFSFMWMMYVGIVGVKSEAFEAIAVPDIYNDKLKCLHLFQCYVEAKSDAEMPKTFSSVFADGDISLNSTTLLPHHISSLIIFMSASSIQRWTILKLYDCNLGDIGMNSLLEHVIKNNENISTLEHVDLSRNNSSPWGVYCAIIRHCGVGSLALCGDEGISEYTKEIADSLQLNTKLQSLILCDIENNAGMLVINEILLNNTTLKDLNVSWKSYCKGTVVIKGKMILATQDNMTTTFKRFPRNFVLFKENVNDIIMDLLCGRYNFTIQIQELHISCNNIVDDTAVFISDYLKHNNTIKVLNLSHNHITLRGMSKLCKSIKHCVSLQYVDLSGNYSSPWGVYCAIIRHCCVSSLTLCGGVGINEYFKEIKDSLQTNVALQSLILDYSTETMCSDKGLISKTKWSQSTSGIEGILYFTTMSSDDRKATFSSYKRTVNVKVMCGDDPENIYLSSDIIIEDAICLLAFGLYNNTTAKKLFLSCKDISVIAMNQLSGSLKYARSLQYVDLSGNQSSPWGVYCTIIGHCYANSLTLCGDEGMKEHVKKIIKNLKRNPALQSLTLCRIGKIGVQSIKGVLDDNTTLKELNMSWNYAGTVIIHRQSIYEKLMINSAKSRSENHEGVPVVDINILYDGDHECSSKIINMSSKGINDDAVYLILFGLHGNTTVREFDLSCNEITDDGAVVIAEYLKYGYPLKILNLSKNCITSKGMNKLSQSIKHPIPLEYVNLCGNISSPWGVYCTIIRHCYANSLTLCGDEGIKEHDIIDSLQANVALQSLLLVASTSNKSNFKGVISDIKGLQSSFCIDTILYFSTVDNDNKKAASSSNSRAVKIKIMFDGMYCHSPEIIKLSNRNITDDSACLISFGLYNNATVKEFDLSCNYISVIGMSWLSQCLKCNTSLQYVNLSGNKSSPWGVYCTVIGYCCVDSLTLCGDEGIEKYVKEVIKNLKRNATLKSLTLYEIGSIGLQSINYILYSNTTLKELNMSWKCKSAMISNTRSIHSKFNSTKSYSNSHEEVLDINIMCDHYLECSSEVVNMCKARIGDDAVYLITFGLYYNTTVKKLDLSYNFITDYGTMAISDCLKTNNTIQELNLSYNGITSKGARQLTKVICINKTLRKLDLSHNSICSEGMMYISVSLKHNTTLLELNYLS